MSKTLLNPKITLKRSYLIFFLSLISISLLYFGWLSVTAATPQVVFSRQNILDNDTEVTIESTVTVASNSDLKFLRDSSNNQYWDYGLVDEADDCDSAGFVDSGNALRKTDDGNVVSFTYAIPTADQHLCLKVLYGQKNSQRFTEYYADFLFDVTAPQITVEQVSLSINAQSDDPSGIKSWMHYTDSSEPTCDDASINYTDEDLLGNNQRVVSLTDADNNKWYCFKAVDGQDNAGYSEPLQVDTIAPNLAVNQIDDSAMVTVTVSQDDDDDGTLDGNADIDVDSWQYIQTTRTCNDSVTNWRDLDGLTDDLNSDRAVITFAKSASSRTYCFRVADEAANYAYIQHKVGSINEPPVINSLRQVRNLVTAKASDAQYLNTNSWQYAIVSSEDCNSGVSNSWQGLQVNGFSINDRGEAIFDINLIDINEDTQDKWLCFRVADNIQSNHGYRSINVDAAAPTINVNQDNVYLTASAPSADSALSSTWYYVRNTRNFDCDEDAFEIYTPARRGYRVTLSNNDVGDYFCFRVADRYNNYGYSNTYKVRSLDTVAPKIRATQSNKYLTVSASASEDIDNDTWEYEDGFSSQPDCDEIEDYRYREVASNRIITLDERDIGDWFCIRAADDAGNYGYLSIRIRAVDATAPRVDVTRDKNTLTAETDDEDVDVRTWQYAVSLTDDNFTCDDENANLRFNTASEANRKVVLDSSDEDKYYCFRVADKAGNYGYEKSRKLIDIETSPVIKVIQVAGENRLEVSTDATDVDGQTWGWAVFNNDPGDCEDVSYTDVIGTGVNQNTRRIFVSDISDSQDGSYYCFRVADTSTIYGDNYGYAKHHYDLSRPIIKVSLVNNVLTVSSDDSDLNSSSWRYARFTNRPNCAGSTINRTLPTNNKITLTEADNSVWLCFRVSDRAGNTGYGLYEIQGINDASIPEVDITQTRHTVIATSASRDLDNSTWRYALSVSEPYCGSGGNLTFVYNQGSPNRVDLTNLQSYYNWICFKVENRSGGVGFAKVKIDRQAPSIRVIQNNVDLSVESSAADLNGNTWGYAKSENNFNCNSQVSFSELDFNSSKISFDLMPSNSGDYYCFRVADNTGNFGYKKIQVDEISLSAPVIKISHKNSVLKVSATNVDNASWQYIRSSADINCGSGSGLSFNQASSGNRSIRLTTADNGYWLCFRVRGENGTYGYAKVLVDDVDSRAPVVTVKQDDDILIATADEAVASWQHVAQASSATPCTASAFSDKDSVKGGNQVALTNDDDQMTYCFKAVDQTGNIGYSDLEVAIDETDQGGKEVTTDNGDDDDQDDDDDSTTGVVITPGDDDAAADADADDDDAEKTGEAVDGDDDGTNWWPIIGGIAIIALIVTIIIVSLVSPKKKDDDSADGDYV